MALSSNESVTPISVQIHCQTLVSFTTAYTYFHCLRFNFVSFAVFIVFCFRTKNCHAQVVRWSVHVRRLDFARRYVVFLLTFQAKRYRNTIFINDNHSPREKKGTRELKQAATTRTSPNRRFIDKTMAVHVRYKSLYASLPSSAKQVFRLCIWN